MEDSSVKNNNAWLSHKGAPSTRSWTGPSDVLLLKSRHGCLVCQVLMDKHLLLADIPNAWGQTRSGDTQSQDSRTSKGTTRQLRPRSVRRFQLHHTPILPHWNHRLHPMAILEEARLRGSYNLSSVTQMEQHGRLESAHLGLPDEDVALLWSPWPLSPGCLGEAEARG